MNRSVRRFTSVIVTACMTVGLTFGLAACSNKGATQQETAVEESTKTAEPVEKGLGSKTSTEKATTNETSKEKTATNENPVDKATQKTASAEESVIRSALTETLDVFKNPTKSNLDSNLGASLIDSLKSQVSEYGIDPYELLAHLFSKFDYSIGDIKVNGDTATVDLTMTNANLQKAFDSSAKALENDTELTTQLTQKLNSGDEEGAYKLYFNKVYEAIESEPDTVTTKTTVNMVKKDGSWDVADSSMSEFISAMYGGIDMSSSI